MTKVEPNSKPSADFSHMANEQALPREARAPKQPLGPLLALKPYILRHKGMVILALIALLVAALTTLVVPMGVRRMIDLGFSAENIAFMDKYFSMLIVVGIILALSSALRFYCVSWIGERVVADLREDVFKRLVGLHIGFYETNHSGEVMSRLTADTTQIKAAVGSSISVALRNIVLFLGAVLMMIVTSPKLSALVLVTIPLIIIPLVAYGRVVRRLSRRAQDSLADASSYASENLGAMQTLQAFTHEKTVRARFASAVEQSFLAAKERIRARAGLTALVIFLVFASVIGILWYGAQEVLTGAMSGGRLGQFVLYAIFAASSMGALSEIWGEVQQTAGAMERMSELLAEQPAISSPQNPQALPSPAPDKIDQDKIAQGKIAFNEVSFSYPSRAELPALENIDFTIEPGETVAIVGPSGAGKTTLFNLLLRFYDVSGGSVQLDGVDIKQAALEDLRRHFAIVPQDVALFSDTIAGNLRYGSADVSDENLQAAAKAAFAHEFIMALPEGYQTRLGERGVTLSGGQRQRLAIARAILRNAPVLLLDEATNALDAESEHLVQTALDQIMQDKTTLVIAHRLATVQKADRILVMEGGKLVELGTHKELLAKDGVYARLARLQFAMSSENTQNAAQ